MASSEATTEAPSSNKKPCYSPVEIPHYNGPHNLLSPGPVFLPPSPYFSFTNNKDEADGPFSGKTPLTISAKLKLFYECPNPFVFEGWKGSYIVKEDDSAIYTKVDLPGTTKEGLKLWIEKNIVHIEAMEAEKDPEYDFHDEKMSRVLARRKYCLGLDLCDGRYKTKDTKALLKDGVLKIVVPKLKVEGNKDALEIKVN